MQFTLGSRVKNAWNAFFSRDPTRLYNYDDGPGSSYRLDKFRIRSGRERSIIASIRTKIAIDVARTTIRHVTMDENGRFIALKPSGLDDCLNLEANIDQTGAAFRQDAVESMLEEGTVALVPIDTVGDPTITNSFDILTMRTARVLEWRPQSVRVDPYNERTGRREELVMPKRSLSIITNPLYAIMNEPNSTHQRLLRKLNILDAIDEQSGSGKLDLIIQLPYEVRSETKRNQAESRKKDIEAQLSGSKYGIAYTGSSERIVQLNRAVENNLMGQIEYLTSMLYSQLGLTAEVFNGTADSKTMENYYARTIEPIVVAFVTEMNRKFLTKTARSQNQRIFYFRDPFSFIPVTEIADIADKFTRNEIMTPNEVRQIIGMKPSADKKSDELRNRNISESKQLPEDGASAQSDTNDQNGGNQ